MSGFWDLLKSFFGSAEGPVHFEAASVSDKGLVRSDNQDSYLMRAQSFFLAVADGIMDAKISEQTATEKIRTGLMRRKATEKNSPTVTVRST